MTTTNKDTIYIDIDEEITGIIDKVRGSSGKIVALVLPKRASVFQSIVNMKLLKRSADDAKKHLVLITSEASLMPLAGAVGLHVAKTPQSKPEIPAPPIIDDGIEETVDEADPDGFSLAAAAHRPVGELAALPPVASNDMETLELDDDDEAVLAAGASLLPAAGTAAAKKPKKNGKLAIPNFERFRLLLILGTVSVILLIVGLVFALKVLPKAEIAINTNTSSVNVGLNLVLNTAAQTVDVEAGTVPAKLASQQKTSTQQAPATGQRNNGEPAAGEITITNCSDEDEITVPAGTGVSSNGLTYITQQALTLELSGQTNSGCKSINGATAGTVDILAQTGGANYNLPDESKFTVAGFSALNGEAVEALAGGTDNIVKVVSQADIDVAKQKLAAGDATIKLDLRRQLQDEGFLPITDSYAAGTPAVTTSAKAGAVADNVTVTATTAYTMFGAKAADLKTVINADIEDQIDIKQQSILDEGLADAAFKVSNASDTAAEVTLTTVATAGPDINVDTLKKQVAGKKGGDIKQLLQNTPGVTDVQVRLSPFWVSSVPDDTQKITITIAKPLPATSNEDDR